MVQSYSSAGANVHPIYRKPKVVAMATSLRTSKSAMSSADQVDPENAPLESNNVSLAIIQPKL